jgi:phosphomannomutase
MAPKFGTSGLRGLVTELTPALVHAYTNAFLQACDTGGAVHLGRDLRDSSPALADAVAQALSTAGVDTVDHGALPTPALALAATAAGQAAVMVTGSHIPADRNGLKFYRPDGEIRKADEAAILALLETPQISADTPGTRHEATGIACAAYVQRYVDAFGPTALKGMRIGVYQHSSVARDVMGQVLEGLGADTVPLARSGTFVPVDTEAVDPDTRDQLTAWCRDHALDALVSTDGDADRPMVTDGTGRLVPGDVLGPLTAQALGAEVVCTPVSSNTLIEAMGAFAEIRRTKIGSPFVIAAMEETAGARVVGYEANGGFLLGFAARGPAGPLDPLMTRDSLLPMIAPLAQARATGRGLEALVAALPPRFTAADRIAGIPTERSRTFLQDLINAAGARAAFFAGRTPETRVDLTDGLRVTFANDTVIHLRPSGNAPEFRCYAEAGSANEAETLMRETLKAVAAQLRNSA